jgi:hypothetical protein
MIGPERAYLGHIRLKGRKNAVSGYNWSRFLTLRDNYLRSCDGEVLVLIVGAVPADGCGVTTTSGGTAVPAGIGTFTGKGGKMLFPFSIEGILCRG